MKKSKPRAEFVKDFKIVKIIFLKLGSQKLRACLEIRFKGPERKFYYFKYTNVTMAVFFIMPITTNSTILIFIFKYSN